MNRFIFLPLVILTVLSCQTNPTADQNTADIPSAVLEDSLSSIQEDTVLKAEIVKELTAYFTSIDSNYNNNTVLLPDGFDIQILFTQKTDIVVRADGKKAPAKGNHDMLAFLPSQTNPNKGWMFVSHETKYADSILGDGGGATMFELEKDENNQWNILSDYEHVDFTTVGNTDRNCGGTVGPNGMIYTCEEYMPKNNEIMKRGGKGHLHTDSVGNLDYWQNIGYVVEVDPKTKKATQKMIGMGRYFHEDLEFMDDNKTVYLSDDYEPGVFFKFVADQELDYSKGQLFAFKQSEDGTSGDWISLPSDTTAMIRARDEAIERGATMFMRHEWIARVGNKIYIAETGHDKTDWSNRFAQGGIASYTLNKEHRSGNIMTDVYGRILVFDTETNEMKPLIEGGFSTDSATVFSNPDCVSATTLGGKPYLIIHEDINKNTLGRVAKYAENKNQYYNELFFLDLTIENPTVDDLKRFAISPMNAEFTGGIMSPDGSTLFLNVQHPHPKNGAPYNKSVTVAITGFSNK